MSDEALGLPPDDGFDTRFKSMGENQLLGYLLHLPAWEYAKVRKAATRHLGVTVGALDGKLAAMRDELGGESGVIEKGMDALAESAAEIIACDDVLGLFEADWCRLVAGEVRNGKLLLLAGTSRLAIKTMSAAIKGGSSGGKSEVRKRVIDFFPPESVVSFTSLSEKALLYFDYDFPHKILSMGEASGADEQSFQDYLLRELISEDILRYPVVQRVGDEMRTNIIEKHGPVVFLVTTTKRKLHPENETRLLSLEIDDSEIQTRAVLEKVAETEGLNATDIRVDFGPWQDFQRWLELGPRAVMVPYAKVLAANIPPRAMRLRRDLGQVLRAIKAHALLHRNHRDVDSTGAIIADIDRDYAAVRDLMHDLLAETAEARVKQTVAETTEVVKSLTKDLANTEGTTAQAVGKVLKLDRSAARRRLLDAQDFGYVINLEARRGQPGKFRVTGESVDVVEMMPAAEALSTMFSPGGAVPPLPPDHRNEITASDQLVSGGTDGGNAICHRDEPQAVANRSATAIATAETPAKLPKTQARWHGGTGGNGGDGKEVINDSELRVDPDDPSTYLDDSDYPLSPDTREANRFMGDFPSEFDRRPSRIAKSST